MPYQKSKHTTIATVAVTLVEYLRFAAGLPLEEAIVKNVFGLNQKMEAVEQCIVMARDSSAKLDVADRFLNTAIEISLERGELFKDRLIIDLRPVWDRSSNVAMAEMLASSLGKGDGDIGKANRLFLQCAVTEARKAKVAHIEATTALNAALADWENGYYELSALIAKARQLLVTHKVALPTRTTRRRTPEEVAAKRQEEDQRRAAKIAARAQRQAKKAAKPPSVVPAPAAPTASPKPANSAATESTIPSVA